MTRTLPRITRQVPALRLPHPAAVPAPRIRRFKPLLAWLRAAAVALLALPRLLTRDEQGHLKTVHWVLLAALLGFMAYAPFVIVPEHRQVHVDFFSLPLVWAGGAWFCGMHAVATWAKGGEGQ